MISRKESTYIIIAVAIMMMIVFYSHKMKAKHYQIINPDEETINEETKSNNDKIWSEVISVGIGIIIGLLIIVLMGKYLNYRAEKKDEIMFGKSNKTIKTEEQFSEEEPNLIEKIDNKE